MVDFWNNLNLVDVYERYNAVDSEEDMKIWISGQNLESEEGIKAVPIQAVATLTNHPASRTTELFVQN